MTQVGAEKTGENYHHHNGSKRERETKCRDIMSGILKSLFLNFMYIFHILLDNLLEFLLNSYLGPRRECPTIQNDADYFIMKSATELSQLIRERKLKSCEIVKAYIDRIHIVNGVLNAIVDGPFIDEALNEAKQIDERIANGEITEKEFAEKPFLGIPFTTKDSTAVKGKLHTLGLISRRDEHAKDDAECVRLMKQAGAIIIATTNVPECNKWMETRNLLCGQTNNPYDTRRSVGGSSGGEAALIAACGTAFGLGYKFLSFYNQ